ncbi:exported hypothetical protein [Candidatus Terasakiella magnetica]|uniref:Solute-binding protein family 3/N-terminal domain-containing protein n=1 Tax=Candidatus Terasakiella magnetica TaxID=1867952 RepID=A0A1C3RCY8_9PROT|nr:transporter substrate-binding domain-containing protein [Candidatus Terasakiella magnetica]SCA55139.1 exported hypothetical protein [Candidatus Terasakiella magnetica]
MLSHISRNYKIRFTAVFVFISLFLFSALVAAEDIQLTAEERDYLRKHSVFTTSNQIDWPPYDFSLRSKPVGYSIDYMEIVAGKLSIKLEHISGTWDELIERFCNGEIQIFHSIDRSEKIRKCANISTRFATDTVQYLTRKEFRNINRVEDVYGTTVSSVKGWEQNESYKKHPGQFKLLEYDTFDQAVEAVNLGVADFTVNYGNSLRYLILKNGYVNLKVQGFWKQEGGVQTDIFIGTPKSDPILAGIIQKAINAVSPQKTQKLQTKWFGGASANAESSPLRLTQSEKQFLNAKQNITYCVSPNWKPIEYLDDEGQHAGMTRDYLDFLRTNLAIDFKVIKTASREEKTQFLQEKRCDMAFVTTPMGANKTSLLHTTPYTSLPSVMVNKLGSSFVTKGMSEFLDKKIAVLKGSALIESFKKKYPNFSPVEVQTIDDGLKRIEEGELYGFIEYLPRLSLYMENIADRNLKIAGRIFEPVDMRVAIQKDQKTLHLILQKSLDVISSDEKDRVLQKWSAITVE